MQIAKYTKEARSLFRDDAMLLIFKIGDCYTKWSADPRKGVTERERFYIGLRYSEFLIDEGDVHSDYNCYVADRQRLAILQTIGVSPDFIREQLLAVYGLA